MSSPAQPVMERAFRIGLPVLAVLVVFGLWLLSDRLIFIGPLDRATFGWGVVIPLWTLLPVIAAAAWGDLDGRGRTVASASLGAVVAITAAAWFWQGLDTPDCEFGALRQATDWLVPTAVVAGVIGLGLGAGSMAASTRWHDGRRVSSVVIGIGLQIGAIALALLLAIVLFSGPACERPPAG